MLRRLAPGRHLRGMGRMGRRRLLLTGAFLVFGVSPAAAQSGDESERDAYEPPTSIRILDSKPEGIPGTMPGDPPTATMPDEIRRDYNENCFENGCHARMRERRWLHGPVAAGACESCHTLDGSESQHKFRQVRPPDERCSHCHIPKETLGVRHEPFAKHECVKCHSPHGGANKAFIVQATLARLCETCHDGKEHDGQIVSAAPGPVAHPHDPVVKGDCDGCHRSHQSHLENLLVRSAKQELCLGCHRAMMPLAHAHDGQADGYEIPRPLPADPVGGPGDLLVPGHIPPPPPPDSLRYYVTGPVRGLGLVEPAPADTLGERVISMMIVHEPVTTDCSACHLSHGSEIRAMLRQREPKLCLDCHENFQKRIASSVSDHDDAFTAAEEPCGRCHLQHGNRFPHLMKTSSRTLCLSCHEKEIVTATGRRIADIAAQLEGAASVHDPVRSGCVSCHLNHASQDRTLLRGHHPEGNYAPYRAATYGFCFACHDREPFEHETTTTSGFRNGNESLHYLHVRGENPRTCGNCHTPHGSPQARLVAEAAAFGPGGILLPVEFEKTANGGSCSSGCHRRLYYDRVTPAEQTTTVRPSGPHD